MPHEFMQFINYIVSFQPSSAIPVHLFDIPMPKCTPKEMCLIHAFETIWDMSANDIRIELWASLEPSDRILFIDTHTKHQQDIFYSARLWRSIDGASGVSSHTQNWITYYNHPVPYPYEKLRIGVRTTSAATGLAVDVRIHYTIEPISAKQLTAITLRRGTVRHARPQGPEPT